MTIRTTCPYCGVGCGVRARPDGAVRGDPEHPANGGRLCSKGTSLGETLSLDGRLLHPWMDGARATWDAALDRVASGFADTIARHGPDSVALYVSGQLLTEDYYAANKLTKGFLGTANIDSNSRLCMSSAVAGHQRAFGEDLVPGTYEDLELADLVVLVGSNLAWCHPVLHQRIAAARAKRPRTRVVVIDPRRTATCEGADLHLPLAPGSDVALFNGLLGHLWRVQGGAARVEVSQQIAERRVLDLETDRELRAVALHDARHTHLAEAIHTQRQFEHHVHEVLEAAARHWEDAPHLVFLALFLAARRNLIGDDDACPAVDAQTAKHLLKEHLVVC